MNTSTQIEAESQKNLGRLEREIDQQRSKVSDLIDELGNEFSPRQLMDRAVGLTKDNGREFAQNLGNTIQAHPVPALLTSAGMVWLYLSRNEPSTASGKHHGGNGTGGGALGDLKDRLSDGADKAREHMDTASSRMGDAGDSIRDQGKRAGRKFNQTLEDNPLALGAVGVALGALLGALLPSTDQEDQLMGEASDSVTNKARQTAQSAVEETRDSLDPE